jgi:hypothetical protein
MKHSKKAMMTPPEIIGKIPPTGRSKRGIQHRPFQMRVSDEFLKSVDKWRRDQPDRPSRAKAIRRLVEQSLGNASDTRQMDTEAQHKAAELASREIDRVGDQAATGEERAQRKRRLIKGPREFRELRANQPKSKK